MVEQYPQGAFVLFYHCQHILFPPDASISSGNHRHRVYVQRFYIQVPSQVSLKLLRKASKVGVAVFLQHTEQMEGLMCEVRIQFSTTGLAGLENRLRQASIVRNGGYVQRRKWVWRERSEGNNDGSTLRLRVQFEIVELFKFVVKMSHSLGPLLLFRLPDYLEDLIAVAQAFDLGIIMEPIRNLLLHSLLLLSIGDCLQRSTLSQTRLLSAMSLFMDQFGCNLTKGMGCLKEILMGMMDVGVLGWVVIQRSSVIICCGTSWAVAFQYLCNACSTTSRAISSRLCNRRETINANSRCSHTSPSLRMKDVHSSNIGARLDHITTRSALGLS